MSGLRPPGSCVIMQPTFLPWLGYFALIDQADIFVFLDDVQFSKQSWQSRNRISGPNGPILISLPIARKPSKPLIRDVRLADRFDLAGLVPHLESILGRAPYWGTVERLMRRVLAGPLLGLAELNIALIRALAAEVGISADFQRSSTLEVRSGDKAERLFDICTLFGATTYLSPLGALDYLREGNTFSEYGTRLRFQGFQHPSYPQRRTGFQSHMSIIDAIAFVGPEETLRLIREGSRPPLTLDEALEAFGAAP